jgi:hypothetical protein
MVKTGAGRFAEVLAKAGVKRMTGGTILLAWWQRILIQMKVGAY